MKKIYFFICFFTFFRFFQSTEKKDSLSNYDYLKLENKLQELYGENETIKFQNLCEYYLKKAKKEKNIEKIAEGYIFIHFSKDFPQSIKYLDSLENISNKLKNDIKYPARVYLLKGNLYFKNDDAKNALSNYLLGIKYAKQKGNQKQIALAEIQIAYLNNYIGKHNEEIQILRKYLYNSNLLNSAEKEQIHLNLADAYIEINKIDSAKILIDEGLSKNFTNKKSKFYNAYLSLSAYCDLKTKNYQSSIVKLNKCLSFFTKGSETRDIVYSYLYIGEAYIGLKNNIKAIDNFKKIDLIVEKENYTFPELRGVYSFLIDYYKEEKDIEKYLYYINQYLKVDKILDREFKYISKELPRQYDAPQLIEQKQILLKELKIRKIYTLCIVLILTSILTLFAFLFYKSRKREKEYKEKARELLENINRNNDKKIEFTNSINVLDSINNISSKEKTIPDQTIKMILLELDKFEKQHLFLTKGITLSSLAKDFNTNSTYLSEVINSYKEMNFATFLNHLRIEYAIKQLIKDKKFRSYKISAIAEILGYNNEQAFSIAFKKKTGTTVSIFIKEIENNIVEDIKLL